MLQVGKYLQKTLPVIQSMSSEEFDMWCAFISWEREEEKKAADKAKKKRGRR